MRRLIASTGITLGGVMGAPDRWSLEFYKEEMDAHARDELSASGGLLMGRVTYEGFVVLADRDG
jgi:dihydrofolate reductase